MARRDDERHRAQIRAATAARNAASARLRAEYPQRYARLYEEEALARGVTPRAVLRRRRAERLRRELEELDGGR